MELATALDTGPLPAPSPVAATRWRPTRRNALLTAGFLVIAATLYVAIAAPYTAASPLGYTLGLVGGVLMLLLLPYALRKRLRCLRQWGTMRGWFLFHIAAGLLGPLLILFHTTFRIGSLNGGVALACTLLVTASGLVGRFFYRQVHRGLSGSRATQEELQAALDAQFARLEPLLAHLPAIAAETRGFLALATGSALPIPRPLFRFLRLGTQRRAAARRIEQLLHAAASGAGGAGAAGAADLVALRQTIDATLRAAQRAGQLATYERLFSLWHTVHLPFLYLLVLTAVVHVVACHAY